MHSLAGLLGAGAIKLLGRTLSIRLIGTEHHERARENGQNVLYAFWHEGLLLATYAFRNQDIRVLVSEHRDGEYIARTIEWMGYTTTRGSSTRGGTRALFRMAAAGAAGDDLGMTVDGPRGPRLQVKRGRCSWPADPAFPSFLSRPFPKGPRAFELGPVHDSAALFGRVHCLRRTFAGPRRYSGRTPRTVPGTAPASPAERPGHRRTKPG